MMPLLYILMSRFGLLDTKTGLIVVYCSLATPFALWNMSNFFGSVSDFFTGADHIPWCDRDVIAVRLSRSTPLFIRRFLFESCSYPKLKLASFLVPRPDCRSELSRCLIARLGTTLNAVLCSRNS